jgi:S1-C subfamily serine protease
MAAMAPAKKTLYEILGVPADAGPEDIGHAHERRVLEMRRMNNPDPNATALVQQAYEVLSNPKRRAAYDAGLVTAAEKSAAAQQATDLEIEAGDGEDDRGRKLRLLGMVGGMALILVALFFVFRPRQPPAPPPPEPVVEAPKPPPPPPPKARTANEIVADANTSSGQLLSYSMSGAATPLGMAVEVETGQMVTTCHAITAGGKLVVRVGKEVLPADLTITDETLDLCRLSVAGLTTPPHRIATEDAKAGDKVFVVSMNAKGEVAATEGKVNQLRPTPHGPVIDVSAPIAASGSGGGVFNEFGQLVGIATAPHAFGAGLNVAIPASWLAQMRSRSTNPPPAPAPAPASPPASQ